MPRPLILQVITRLDRGGSAEVVLDFAEALRGESERLRGCRVAIVSGRVTHPQTDLAEYQRRTGVPIYVVPSLVRQIHPWRDWVALICLVRLMVRLRPRLVHTHTSKAGVLGRLAAWLARVPAVVHTPHGHIFYGYAGRLGSASAVVVERIMARFAHRITTLTGRGRMDHLRRGIGSAAKIRVIPCGIKTAPFLNGREDRSAARAALGIGPEAGAASGKVVAWVGRLVPVKAPQDFVKAFDEMRRRVAGVKAVVVGDGPLRDEVTRLVAERGLSGSVAFLGERDDIAIVLAAADLFVLTSKNEGLGRALLEAMACGVPVVATAVGGVPEIVEDEKTGLLVPAEEPRSLAAAMTRVLRDEELASRLAAAGRIRAERYDWRHAVDSFVQLYGELL